MIAKRFALNAPTLHIPMQLKTTRGILRKVSPVIVSMRATARIQQRTKRRGRIPQNFFIVFLICIIFFVNH